MELCEAPYGSFIKHLEEAMQSTAVPLNETLCITNVDYTLHILY